MNNTKSEILGKALQSNSEAAAFAYPDVLGTEPVADGDHRTGYNRATAPQQILAIPFCGGAPATQFVMRLYEWRVVGQINDENGAVWIPLLLAELRCTVGAISGLSNRLIRHDEFFASEIALMSGNLGMNGVIVNGPIAYVKIDLQGGQKIRFAFAPDEENATLFGNALFVATSAY